MNRKRKYGDFKEKEVLHSVGMRKGEELRFAVVEVDGKTRGDIRYFSEAEEGMRPTTRGIMVDPAKLGEIQKGVQMLQDRFTKK